MIQDWERLVMSSLMEISGHAYGRRTEPAPNKFDRKKSAKKAKAQTKKRQAAATKRDVQERKSRNA